MVNGVNLDNGLKPEFGSRCPGWIRSDKASWIAWRSGPSRAKMEGKMDREGWMDVVVAFVGCSLSVGALKVSWPV